MFRSADAPYRGGRMTQTRFQHPAALVETRTRGMTKAKIAEHLGVKANALSPFFNRKRGLTMQLAFKLEAAFPGYMSAEEWMKVQAEYDVQKAELEGVKDEAIKGVTPVEEPDQGSLLGDVK